MKRYLNGLHASAKIKLGSVAMEGEHGGGRGLVYEPAGEKVEKWDAEFDKNAGVVFSTSVNKFLMVVGAVSKVQSASTCLNLCSVHW